VWTITNFKTFPHFHQSEVGKVVNGGIPQKGNMTIHFAEVRKDVENLFPGKNFSGYAVIDWEEWYPWLIIASNSLYVNESFYRRSVREVHPSWSKHEIEQEAVRSWMPTRKALW
jgi:hypothetical protein